MGQPNSQPETFSNVQPIAQQETFSNVTPIDAPPPRGFFANLGSDLKNMVSMPRGVSPYPGMDQEAKTEAATEATQQDQGRKAAGYSLPYRALAPVAQSLGANVTGMEESAKQGDEAGVLGHAAAVPVAIGAGELSARLGPKVPSGRLAKTMGKAVGGVIDDIPAVRQLGKVRQYWNETAPKPTYPGAPLPEAPPAEVTQARVLSTGAKPAIDPAEGLGKIKGGKAGQLVAAMKPDPTEVAPGFKRGNISDLLEKSLGAKKLEPNVPLRQQMPTTAKPQAPTEAPAQIPEGHTALDSTALRSFKYDPAEREFHAYGKSGDIVYVYGDASPEQAKAFQNASSKGKAWQDIKNNNPLVAKIINGKRVAMKQGAGSE